MPLSKHSRVVQRAIDEAAQARQVYVRRDSQNRKKLLPDSDMQMPEYRASVMAEEKLRKLLPGSTDQLIFTLIGDEPYHDYIAPGHPKPKYKATPDLQEHTTEMVRKGKLRMK